MADQSTYLSKLRGKHALIIGGSSGIGYAVAEAVLELGGSVTISSSNQARVETAITSLGTSYPSMVKHVNGIPCDLSDEDTVESNIVHLFEETGHIDHLVFTAGDAIAPVPVTAVTLESIKASGSIRYTALLFVVKHAVKFLRPGPSSSITLTTGVGLDKPLPGWSGILGPRIAVVGFGKALALDLKPIRVNTVAVGIVDTNQFASLSPDEREERLAAMAAKMTTGRVAEASDVAEAYIYCMKDKNVTGSVISTNGGMTLL